MSEAVSGRPGTENAAATSRDAFARWPVHVFEEKDYCYGVGPLALRVDRVGWAAQESVSGDGRAPAAAARPTATPSSHRSGSGADEESDTTSAARPTDEAAADDQELESLPTTHQQPMRSPLGSLFG